MRHLQSGSMTSSGRSASWTLLLAVAFVLGFLFPAAPAALGGGTSGSGGGTTGGGATGGGTTGGGTTSGGDDETIGTLPILGSGGQFDLVRHFSDPLPDFYLEGAFDEILSTIIGYSGTGKVTLENRAGGLVRLGFHGELQLSLDRSLLQATGIQIGSSVPDTFRGARAQIGIAGRLGQRQALRAGNFRLPIAALDGIDALSQYPWVFTSRTRLQGGYQFHALADQTVLYLGQSYH